MSRYVPINHLRDLGLKFETQNRVDVPRTEGFLVGMTKRLVSFASFDPLVWYDCMTASYVCSSKKTFPKIGVPPKSSILIGFPL